MLGAWDKNSGAGTDMASKLAQTVSANKLANSYMAFNTNYHDTGGWLGGWWGACRAELLWGVVWVGGTVGADVGGCVLGQPASRMCRQALMLHVPPCLPHSAAANPPLPASACLSPAPPSLQACLVCTRWLTPTPTMRTWPGPSCATSPRCATR